jgi:hypothetical protein
LSRDKLALEADFFFFPLDWSWRHRSLATCSDWISIFWPRHHVSAPNTYGGSIAIAMASAEKREFGPLRPRNISVPSYRPMQSGGSTQRVGQLVPGSGEGQHTYTGRDARRRSRAGADVQSKAEGSGPKRLCAPTRSLTHCDHPSTLWPGSARDRPVRRSAHPLRSLTR